MTTNVMVLYRKNRPSELFANETEEQIKNQKKINFLKADLFEQDILTIMKKYKAIFYEYPDLIYLWEHEEIEDEVVHTYTRGGKESISWYIGNQGLDNWDTIYREYGDKDKKFIECKNEYSYSLVDRILEDINVFHNRKEWYVANKVSLHVDAPYAHEEYVKAQLERSDQYVLVETYIEGQELLRRVGEERIYLKELEIKDLEEEFGRIISRKKDELERLKVRVARI